MQSVRSANRTTRAPASRSADVCELAVTLPAKAASFESFCRWTHAKDFPEHCKLSFLGDQVYVELGEVDWVSVPLEAFTLEGFRRWSRSREFPEHGQVFFLDGEIFIDMSPERLDTHNKVKTEITRLIATMVQDRDAGNLYSDRARVVHKDANIANEPDALFASWDTLESGRCQQVPSKSKEGDYVELEGTPDWVLEIVSPGSKKKDTLTLRQKYHRAGVAEYWLVDARGRQLSFQILVRGESAYLPQKKKAGWIASPLFDCKFRLERKRDRLGQWQYRLLTK